MIVKTNLFYLTVLLLINSALVGCSDDSSNDGQYTRCFTLKDSQTGEPVDGARLSVNYSVDSKLGTLNLSSGGVSDSDGSVCIEFLSGAEPNGWGLIKDNYKQICNWYSYSFPPNVIEMEYEGYLRLDIINEEPYSEEDAIIVSYQYQMCSGTSEILLNGVGIDTTIINRADPISQSIIDVESLGTNPYTNSIEVIIYSRDTTSVSIVY